jgi:hypothetical protein
MPAISLDAADAIELAELLQLIDDWLQSGPGNLTASLARFMGSPAYGPAELRGDFARFRFLLGITDGEVSSARANSNAGYIWSTRPPRPTRSTSTSADRYPAARRRASTWWSPRPSKPMGPGIPDRRVRFPYASAGHVRARPGALGERPGKSFTCARRGARLALRSRPEGIRPCTLSPPRSPP